MTITGDITSTRDVNGFDTAAILEEIKPVSKEADTTGYISTSTDADVIKETPPKKDEKLPDSFKVTPVPVKNIGDKVKKVSSVNKKTECQVLSVKDLEDSVNILIRVFPRHIQRAIDTYADLRHVEKWKFVCGLLNASYQNAGFTSPIFDHSWSSETPIIQYETICKGCEEKFEPIWRDQLYCTDACGRKSQGL